MLALSPIPSLELSRHPERDAQLATPNVTLRRHSGTVAQASGLPNVRQLSDEVARQK
jgi:hypothetical protein